MILSINLIYLFELYLFVDYRKVLISETSSKYKNISGTYAVASTEMIDKKSSRPKKGMNSLVIRMRNTKIY